MHIVLMPAYRKHHALEILCTEAMKPSRAPHHSQVPCIVRPMQQNAAKCHATRAHATCAMCRTCGAHVPLVLYIICIPSALSAHAILSPTVSMPISHFSISRNLLFIISVTCASLFEPGLRTVQC